jgi:hypothetical protein
LLLVAKQFLKNFTFDTWKYWTKLCNCDILTVKKKESYNSESIDVVKAETEVYVSASSDDVDRNILYMCLCD